MFGLSQFGKTPIQFPYFLMLEATLVAAALAVGYHFAHPAGELTQVPVIAAVMILWFCLLFVLRIIPTHHWGPIRHIVRSALGRRSALKFNKRAGLRSLDGPGRKALRAAVDRPPPRQDTRPGVHRGRAGEDDGDGLSWMVHPDAEGARLVRLLRQTGREGGVVIDGEGELDAGISLFLFSDQPVAVSLRRMRQLLADGVDPNELRTLEDLRNDLARGKARGLEGGRPAEGTGAPRRRGGRRREGGGRRP